MPLDILLGAQWGDEGKGRITDVLAGGAQVIARFGGGDNAGHTVTVGTRLFKLHLIPSGILRAHATCVLGGGMVINPITLVQEIESLRLAGVEVTPARLKLSKAAHIITPGHLALDGAEEGGRAGSGLGTTRRGIGPAYTDKAGRRGIRAGAMGQPSEFARLIEGHVRRADRLLESQYQLPPLDAVEAARLYQESAEQLRPYLADTGAFLHDALRAGSTVLAEGAQGTLLDLDHGTYPYVTSSSTIAAGALTGLGVGPRHVRKVIGVAKSFQTRVGAGPFPTELHGETAERLRGSGTQPWDEFGTTTGRPRRVGWLDAVLLRYAQRVNGFTELALTKLDILTGLPRPRLCTAYRRAGSEYTDLPEPPSDLETFSPTYEDLDGWQENLASARHDKDLPVEARRYLERIETLVAVPITLVSVGPERDMLIHRETRL